MNAKSRSSTNIGPTTNTGPATNSGSKKNNQSSAKESSFSIMSAKNYSFRSNTNEKRSNQMDKLKKNIEKLESLKTKMPLSVYKREITKLQTRLKQLQNTKDLENAKPKRESSLRSYTSENRSVEQGRNTRRSTSTPTPSPDSGSPLSYMNYSIGTPSTGGAAVNMSLNGSMVGSTSGSPFATPVNKQKLRNRNAQSQKPNNRANRDSVGGRKGNNSISNNNVYFNQNQKKNNGNK